MQKKAGIYIRVSTLEQAESGYSVEEQKKKLIHYCEAMDWNVAGLYVDGGYSGSNMDRPGLQKMLKEIQHLDIVLVYKLDRLSRSQKDTLSIIEDSFLKNKIDFVSLQEKLDTTTPAGRLMIGILSAFAQLERETFMERSKMGRTGRAREGKWIGTSRPPIGYEYDQEKQQLVINAYEAEQVKEVFNLYQQGTGLQRIAEIMHTKGHTHKYGDWTWWGGVTTMLTNTVYIGKVKFNDQEFDGNHQPIIETKQFESVQAMLKSRTKNEIFKRKSPFSHLLKCGNCGAKMFFLHKKDSASRVPRYNCYSRHGKPIGFVKDRTCKMRNWPVELIDKHILEQINIIANSREKLEQYFVKEKHCQDNRAVLQKQYDDLQKQIDRLMNLYQMGDMPIKAINNIHERINKLYSEQAGIRSVLDSINEAAADDEVNAIQLAAEKIRDNWEQFEIPEQIELVDMLINKVVVNETSVEIHWNIL